MRIRLFWTSLSGLMLAVFVSAGAVAAEAEDIIKYRQGVMKSVGGHTVAAAQIVRGKVDYGDHLAYHVESITQSMKTVLSLFPDGSDFGETRALPEIWSQPDQFKQVAEQAGAAAEAFLTVVQAGDKGAWGGKFKAMVDSCKACHKDFRQKDEQ